MSYTAMTTMKISNVNPGDRFSSQKNFLPVLIDEDVCNVLGLLDSDSAVAPKLVDHLKRFSQSQNVEVQVSVVKELCKEALLISEDELKKFYLTAMFKLYLWAPFKHPVKSALSKSFSTMSSVHSTEISLCTWNVIKASLPVSPDHENVVKLQTTMGNLYAYYSDLQMRPAEENIIELLHFINFTLQFCCSSLKTKTSTLSVDLCDLLISTSMVAVATLRTMKKFNKVDGNVEKVLQLTFTLSESLLNDRDLPYDILCNFGLAIVLIIDIRSTQEWLMVLDGAEKPVVLSEDMQRLCICHGLLSGLSQESWVLNHPGSPRNFLSWVLQELLKIHNRAGNNGVIILGVSRTILKALTVPASPSLIKSGVLEILSLVWSQLDHYTDAVRHVTQTILEQILSLHKQFQEENIELTENIFNAMQSFSNVERSKYTCLSLMAKYLGSTEVLDQVPNLIADLTDSLLNPIISSHASDALVALMTAHKKSSKETWISTWVPPLLAILSRPSTEAHNVEYVLTVAVKMCPQVAMSVILKAVSGHQEDIRRLSVIIMCLKIGKKLGIQDITCLYNHLMCSEEQTPEPWENVDLFQILKVALKHEHDTVRSSALSVIVETPRSTEPLYEKELLLLKEFLKYNVNYDIPSARQKGLALFQKILLRIKLSACTLQRKIKEDKSSKLYSVYQNFLNWLQTFCFNNLFVGANFSRRCWALKILSNCKDLSILDTSSKLQWNSTFIDPQNISILMNVVLADTFEDNKKMATDLLMSLPKECMQSSFLKNSLGTDSLFNKGCYLSISNRPSDTVSAAYMLQLSLHFEDVCNTCPEGSKILVDSSNKSSSMLRLIRQLLLFLEEQLKTAQDDVCSAAVNGPMYGTLFAIRKLLHICDFSKLSNCSAWNDLINDLIELSFKVNAAVVGIVNSSSPEGHLPMDFGKGMHGDVRKAIEPKVTAQMILLCSWRTVKEVSLLLGELSERCPIRPKNLPNDNSGIMNEDTLYRIGNHFLTLMEETKHRGAFEQAAVGFRLLVSRLWRYTGGDACEWPVKWLNEILNIIQSTSTVNKLCATRRSAGIPFMVQALVGTEPLLSRNRPYLNSTITTLLELAGPSAVRLEHRTHAFNILRALFRDACLGEFVLPYVEQGFIVAIKGFRCKTWSERNSATLLFSALMTRVFGVRRSRGKLSSRNKMTSYTFFQNYPNLYAFLLEEIQLAGGSLESPTSPDVATLHPVLLVLARLYPSTLEGLNTTVQLNMFVPWVRLCASCCVYKTRCLAAEAMVPLITINTYEEFILSLLSNIASKRDENSIHGLLLQCTALLHSACKTNLQLTDNVTVSFFKCIKLLDGSHSPMVELSFLQVAELTLQLALGNRSVLESLSNQLATSLTSSGRPKRLATSLSDALAARVLLELQVILETDCTSLILVLISHSTSEVTKEAIFFLFYLLLDSGEVSFHEEFDDEDEGVDDLLTVYYGDQKPWPLTLPVDKRNKLRNKLNKEELSCELAKQILGVETNSDFQEIRYVLSALSRLPERVWNSRKLVDKVLTFLDHPQESVKRAALCCICSYWKFLQISDDHLTTNDYDISNRVSDALLKFSSIESCLGNRFACARFLNEHEEALKKRYAFLGDKGVCILWTCAMRLIADDDINVRQAVAKFSVDDATLASHAQEKMVELFADVMGKSNPLCQATLLLWAFGTVPDYIDENTDLEEDRVFDKGEMNTYAEEEIFTEIVLNYVDLDIIKELKEDAFRWIYSTLFGEMPSNDIQVDSALSLYNVVYCVIFNDQERKSLCNELSAASSRLNKIFERLVHFVNI